LPVIPLIPHLPLDPQSALRAPIIKAALGRFDCSTGLPFPRLRQPESGTALIMKPIRIVLAPTRSRPVNIFLGMVLLLVSILLFLALATYHVGDPSLNTATGTVTPHNWIGLFGAYLGDLLLQALGITAFLLPLWLGGVAWTWVRSRPGGSPILRWMGTLLALTFLPAVLGLLPWHWRWLHVVPIGGVVGRLMSGLLVVYMNIQGAWLVAAALAAAGLYFASDISFGVIRENLAGHWARFQEWRDRRRDLRRDLREEEEELEARRSAVHGEGNGAIPFSQFDAAANPEMETEIPAQKTNRFLAFFMRRREPKQDPIDEIPAYQRADRRPQPEEPALNERAEAASPLVMPRRTSIWERREAETAREVQASPTASELARAAAPAMFEPIRMPAAVAAPPAPVDPWANEQRPSERSVLAAASPEHAGEIAIHSRADAEAHAVTVAPKHVSGYKLPPSTLLSEGEGPQSVREDELREEARVLVEKCAEFDVRGQVVQINPGPMVTTFEFKPEAGVKYSRVTGLADDLCLAMRAESILIERMPGKSTVGIQVPNREKETIHLRDVIESETFARARSRLTLAMGKDINGRIVTADLASMPHVLIAGSTGSGKSVAINAMIMSLLYRTTPQQVRLILVDPKRVELGMYEGVPHLFTPIITEPKLAANALRNAVREMERRLKLLASRSVRNIDQYNKLFEGSTPSLFDESEQQEEPLPYIIIIIDELADLMMLDRANVEESVTRLAQMARAVGIHLILATQRPSVDVITGLIKANVPTRISFRLATKVDSRTILDTNGAEALLGRGDLLFLPPGTSRLMRLHAPYVSEKETAAVVEFWKNQGTAEYVEDFLEAPKDERTAMEGASGESSDDDPMFDDAVRLVFEFGKASTSLLQRRLRIGYGRAAHLIDMMERDGLVGAADGPRPRELLKAPGWLHEVAANQ
jgi:DNA segregation ATPase FtsK/SpoIIIE, S-DNA-T family